MILTSERVEDGIKSGKIQRYASSSTVKKPFSGKKEVSVAYGQKNQSKVERRPTVGAVMISNLALTQRKNNQHR